MTFYLVFTNALSFRTFQQSGYGNLINKSRFSEQLLGQFRPGSDGSGGSGAEHQVGLSGRQTDADVERVGGRSENLHSPISAQHARRSHRRQYHIAHQSRGTRRKVCIC